MAWVDELTGTERRVLAAVAAGEELDLRVGDAERDDPQRGADWDDARSVGAEFLYDLCVGAHDEWRVQARGLRLRGARITGELNLEAATVAFPLTFRDCWLDQPLVLSQARLVSLRLPGTHLPGITADQLETRRNVALNDGFHATGEVNLIGAHIGGQLDCDGGTFTNPNSTALNADQLTVDQNMYLRDGFHATGEVRLIGAHIGGQLACDGGTFANPNGYALDGEQMTVVGPLLLRPKAAPEGTVDLTHARVGRLADARETWPAALRLDGFVYDAIKATPEVGVEQRLGWLDRDPDGYSPHKYEQLAAAYRGAGHEQEARTVAIAKQRARRQQLSRPARLWSRLLGVTVGYGYQPWRALWWLAGFVAVGGQLFATAYPEAMTVIDPTKQPPMFQPVIYALDVLLPIVDLRQQDFWIPDATRPWGQIALGWFWLSIAASWVLTTAVAAAVTGLLKTD